MKIIHSSGKELKLNPGTVLEMERTNPFFNEYGEQSLPVKLPPDAHNFRVLGLPNEMAGTRKIAQKSDAVIQEGVFSIRCRQAILSASTKEGIDTSFYLNTGSFYEKMKDVQLSTVFKNKTVKFSSVDDAIRFVRGLMVTPDPRFSCFPVLIEHPDTGEIICLNRVTAPRKEDGYLSLYNEVARSETVDEKTVSVPAGYYITPLVKAMHVLEEIFKHFGYTLNDSFFSRTEPFRSMVWVNNNIDTIVNSEIKYEQLLPDCMVSTILDVFRCKFCCEFIPDETRKTVSIETFNEVIDGNPVRDLTGILLAPPEINHGKAYKQIKLSSEKTPVLDFDSEGKLVTSTPDYMSKTLQEIATMYPDAVIDKSRGWIYREGFAADRITREYVGTINGDYYAGGTLEAEKKESPDTLVYITSLTLSNGIAPFIGSGRSLNSSIVWDEDPQTNGTSKDTTQKKSELSPMLCFTVHIPANRMDFGTIYAHAEGNERLWNYALCYNGPDGLFERFWRKRDDLLRNSMRDVTCQMLLSETDKLSLSAHRKVVINNQELLPNVTKYTVGKKTETKCTFLTTKLYQPVSTAKQGGKYLPDGKYRWVPKWKSSVGNNYTYCKLKKIPDPFFLPPPTEAQYNAGGKYHEKAHGAFFGITLATDSSGRPIIEMPVEGTLTTWLEPEVREY